MTNEEGTYQPIYAFAHFNPDHIATFLQIHHSSGNKPLEVTSEHLLFLKGQAEPVTAAEVRIGDELRLLGRNASSTILHITEVERAGIFAPLTKEGTIVVDGAVASNYASLIGEEKNPSARSLIREVLDEHTYCHLGLAPFRLLCAFAPSLCDSYDTDGMPYYISAGIWLTRFATLKCPMIIQWLFLVIFLVVTYACILVERLSGSFLVYLIGASVGVLFLARRQQEKVA